MNQYNRGIHISFCPVYEPSTTHEYQGYHIDLKDHLAVTFFLIGEIVHEGRQANVLSMKENKKWFYH